MVNTERTASARSANRRSQPRTVSAGRAESAAIRRNPTRDVAFNASADTITAAVSARRSNAVTGNNTCVTPHPVHRDRRGHSSTGPSAPRNCRGRPRPQPASTPPQAGQLSSPAANLRST
jgi:hypothetical protein